MTAPAARSTTYGSLANEVGDGVTVRFMEDCVALGGSVVRARGALDVHDAINAIEIRRPKRFSAIRLRDPARRYRLASSSSGPRPRPVVSHRAPRAPARPRGCSAPS